MDLFFLGDYLTKNHSGIKSLGGGRVPTTGPQSNKVYRYLMTNSSYPRIILLNLYHIIQFNHLDGRSDLDLDTTYITRKLKIYY